MRLFHMAIWAVGLMCLVANVAQAQGKWQPFDNKKTGYKGAVVCPLDDPETTHYFCYMVGCQGQKPLMHRVFFHGGTLPHDLQARMRVDGAEVGQMVLRRTDETSFEDYEAAYDVGAHDDLIEALMAGSKAELVLSDQGGNEVLQRPLSLRGSSKALRFAKEQCRRPPPPPVKDPLSQVVAEVEKDCKGLGGTVQVGEQAIIKEDFDRDGLMDQVIDWSEVQCDKFATLFCGSAGCPMGFYRQLPEGGYVRVGGGHMYGYRVTVKPVVTLFLHGSACGKVGAEECSKSFTVENNDFVPLQ